MLGLGIAGSLADGLGLGIVVGIAVSLTYSKWGLGASVVTSKK